MSSKNTKVKRKLIALYGAECFIDKLHLRPPEVQAELNKRFKEYKECKVVYSDDVKVDFEIHATTFEIDERAHIKSKYNRAKEKEKSRRRIEEEYDRDDH